MLSIDFDYLDLMFDEDEARRIEADVDAED